MTGARYEVKLVGDEHAYHSFVAELRQLPVGLRPQFAPRVVQSVYFDSQDGRAVRENLAGISDRRKVRLRWYGPGRDAVAAQLECKLRRGSLGDKITVALPAPVAVAGQLRHRFVAALQRALGRGTRAAHALDGLEPTQWIRYRREYLQSPDGSLRVTLDRDMVASDQRAVLRLDDRRRTPLPRLMIVEIKADVEQRDALERLVGQLPLRPSKCSKFVMASLPSDAPIPSAY